MSSVPITVFSKEFCVQCTATYRALDKLGLDYTVVRIDEDEEALTAIMAMGHMQAPVVMAGAQHWSGFRPDLIKALAVQTSVA
ncbi:glutaredoxin-like protein NrdH [Ornithinimicrobium kibberense]|uniref:Glutaredoxin-like protein NrdH n=1 Tax=Ornithinimicrobium kibberense TaxID=282060 RepID=A0ABV5V6E2_9MICO|nr:glutaredoxin-like protein NrdH [Ornithinimicrobium kibberense]